MSYALRVALPALAAAGALAAAHVASAAAPLRVYAAASTKEAMEAVGREFTKDTGIPVEVSPGPSSKLAKQIVEGGPAELFLSADQASADYLAEKQLVERRRNLLGNRLVVVAPAASTLVLQSLADLARAEVAEIALALEKVPAGEYAREALRRAGVWERVEGKVIGGEDVRAVIAFVQRGAATGFVYVTDTAGNSRVRTVLEVDPALHRPIEYALVLVRRAPARPEAVRLYDFLLSDKAADVFRAAKFAVLR